MLPYTRDTIGKSMGIEQELRLRTKIREAEKQLSLLTGAEAWIPLKSVSMRAIFCYRLVSHWNLKLLKVQCIARFSSHSCIRQWIEYESTAYITFLRHGIIAIMNPEYRSSSDELVLFTSYQNLSDAIQIRLYVFMQRLILQMNFLRLSCRFIFVADFPT